MRCSAHGAGTCLPVQESRRRYTCAGLERGNRKNGARGLWTCVRDDRNSGLSDPPAFWSGHAPNGHGQLPQRHFAGLRGVVREEHARKSWCDSRGKNRTSRRTHQRKKSAAVSFTVPSGHFSIFRSTVAAMRFCPSLYAFRRRVSLAPMGAQKYCSRTFRVIEHSTARSREKAVKTTSFPSGETLASAARVLSMATFVLLTGAALVLAERARVGTACIMNHTTVRPFWECARRARSGRPGGEAANGTREVAGMASLPPEGPEYGE